MIPILAVLLLALGLVLGQAALPGLAADHLDAPGLTSPGGDGRLDINDVYAFQSPANPENTVLIMTVNPAAGVLSPTTFHPSASYEFQVDSDGDAYPNLKYKIRFSAPSLSGEQLVMLSGGGLTATGWTGQDIPVRGGGTLRADLFDDPFFFDLNAFLGTDGRTFCDGGENNFFLGLNGTAIALEVPSDLLGDSTVGVWATTMVTNKQIDRMGRPAINTVFIPNNPFEPPGSEPSQKNAFNMAKPNRDQLLFRSEVVDTLQIFYPVGDPTIDALADFLLPDILTVDTSSAGGFPNGRALADDVIDIELGLVTNGAVTSDCVGNDSAFSGTFPYLAPAN
jgi:hypothetical protein